MSNMRKVVFITGASRGIGAAIAKKFASLNFDLIINYLKSDEKALSLKKELENKYNINVLLIKADLSKELEINNMLLEIKNRYSNIDVLINNAGICNDSIIDDKTKESFTKILDVNLIAPFLISREIAKIMHRGVIINISSTNGIDTYYPYSLDYDASKAALNSLTHNLSVAYAPNIRVNAIACGWVDTDMNKDLDEKDLENEMQKCLLKRFAKPEEIANVAYFLASDEASYINNTIIRVDGGFNG